MLLFLFGWIFAILLAVKTHELDGIAIMAICTLPYMRYIRRRISGRA